jgi:salicylate hydroxylase
VPSRRPHVVIIGAGIGGLTLALLLQRRGIHADVLEQSAELGEVGAAVALYANGTRVLRHLGLGESLAEVSEEPTRLTYRDGRDGRLIAATQDIRWYHDTFGAPLFGLHRRALQRILADALRPGQLRLGCHVDALEERDAGMRVRVQCSAGATFGADVLVGADGVHSLARDWVTGGDEAMYSGTSGFRGLVPVELLPSLPEPGALQFWIGPGAHLLHYPISGGTMINFLAVIEGPEKWPGPAWMEAAKPGAHLAAFAGWHPAVTEMVGAVPQSPRWGLFARKPLGRWSRGPVVLLGDAAHAMLPHYGQGANQTIEDAAILAAELDGGGDIPAALRRYEVRRRVRTRQIQLLSWAASPALHLQDGPAARRRDAFLTENLQRVAWIQGYDALAAPEKKPANWRRSLKHVPPWPAAEEYRPSPA